MWLHSPLTSYAALVECKDNLMARTVDDIISDNEGLVTEDEAESIRQDEMREERAAEEDARDAANHEGRWAPDATDDD